MKQRALFLDRDGTLVLPRHYPTRPEQLALYEGVGPLLRDLQATGLRLVVITNQSAIARGYLTESGLQRMHEYLALQLARFGVHLDGIYHCPHHPDGVIPHLAISCDCRKPESGMLRRAAADLQLDLRRSWLIGDILDDVEAGNRVGCRTVLVDLGTEGPPARRLRRPAFVARDTRHALRIVSAVEGCASPVELTYRPAGWRSAARRAQTRVPALRERAAGGCNA